MGITNWSRGRVLGRGSTAVVSLASSSYSCELFAVKSAELARSEFLQREQRIHSLVSTSPYVVSYLGFDITHEPSASFYNLFLEYAPGGSLYDQIKKHGVLCEAGIRARAQDIVRGIAHLHSKGIAHCDVKGQNVLVGCDGRAKIADLGCARFVHGADGCKGKFMGTPMFMAPETARGEDQGTAADIWAVGCTVIEMATGRPPWHDATDAVSLLHRIAFTGDLPEVPEWLSEEGKDFLGKCLAREANDRCTAEELLMHPFLSSSVSNLDSECNWTSPKSTLDRSFWDSMSEEEDEEGAVSVRNGISELFSRSGGPEWTWDGNWLTVRVEETASTDRSIAPAGSSSETIALAHNSTTSTTAGISEQDFYSVFSTNHVATGRLQPATGDNCDVISSRDCDHNVTKLLLIANWIFPLVPLVALLLYFSSLLCCLQCFNSWIKVRLVIFVFISLANENKDTRGVEDLITLRL